MERTRPRGSASVELWRTVRAAATALHPRCATPRCRATPRRSHCTRAALCDSALSGCAPSELLPTEPLLVCTGSTGQVSTAPSSRRRTASGARRTASDARSRWHGPGEHGATRATLNSTDLLAASPGSSMRPWAAEKGLAGTAAVMPSCTTASHATRRASRWR
jgi:hypothetical protein